jgi:hypothetical protein
MDKEAIARELLAAEYERDGEGPFANEILHGNINRTGMGRSLRAIVAALDRPTAILALQSSERGERIAELEQQVADHDARDEIITRLAGGLDAVDSAADKWVELTEVRRSIQAVASVFANWASDDIMQRFIDSIVALQHLAFGEGFYIAYELGATLSPAEPSPESREGWQPIEALTKGDGYVLGWSGRSDDCGEREYFMGRLYDIRPGALLNEWTGRWRGATHWRPLPSPPASAIRALSAPAHD